MCNCEWQTIESAPKDGTRILLSGLAWNEHYPGDKKKMVFEGQRREDQRINPASITAEREWEMMWLSSWSTKPTRWQPLPPPPIAALASGEGK